MDGYAKYVYEEIQRQFYKSVKRKVKHMKDWMESSEYDIWIVSFGGLTIKLNVNGINSMAEFEIFIFQEITNFRKLVSGTICRCRCNL